MRQRLQFRGRLALVRLSCVLLAACATAAFASDRHRAEAAQPLTPQYRQECGACHIAYPPGLLPAPSWQRLLGNLPRHFGTDASLETAVAGELSAWLAAVAGTYKRLREQPPQERITRSGWFLSKHDEVPASVWRRPAVRSPANCSACHARAEQGDFNEHDIRIPR